MKAKTTQKIIDENWINECLQREQNEDQHQIADILNKAKELAGLTLRETAALMQTKNPTLIEEIHHTARYVKETIYGRRLVFFAPLYTSNQCDNECSYCSFRRGNLELERRRLTSTQIENEVRQLVRQGHKRLLLVAGESGGQQNLEHALESLQTIYSIEEGRGKIRRVNVNIAPLNHDGFRRLKGAGIGTYQLFQETYDRQVYEQVHTAGLKKDYDWRITAMDRAMEAGIDDVGIGVLFGLSDWRFEVLAMLSHAQYLEKRFNVGPHTISVPRIEPAEGAPLSKHPPQLISDDDFKMMIAILRLAVPYTGLILSTRETADLRRQCLELGISQLSAGSSTEPGGYSENKEHHATQFATSDNRPLEEVICDVVKNGFIPSFCTGCYRLGRTGSDFMDLAKPGEIRRHCDPNAVSSFTEYLRDYASEETGKVGETAIESMISTMDQQEINRVREMVRKVKNGESDVFC